MSDFEPHRKQLEFIKKNLQEMLDEWHEANREKRDEELDEREASLETREAAVRDREDALQEREAAMEDEQPQGSTQQWQEWNVRPGWREICNTCKVNFCTRPGDCSTHKDGFHNCYKCHRDYINDGYKGGQWMKREKGKGKGGKK